MIDCSRLRSAVVELDHFTDASGIRYRARTRSGKQYLISEAAASLLAVLDGKRTSAEIAATFSKPDRLVTASNVDSVVESSLLSSGLVELVEQRPSDRTEPRSGRKTKGPFDFVLRIPLLTRAQIEPLANLCAALFRPPLLHLCLFVGLLAHVAFYGQPYLQRLSIDSVLGRVSTWQIVIVYALALATMLLHELGHASACRKYGCEHAEIGFCLYLIFPALYIDLSAAWRLPRLQRAVIDIGGMYFQFLSVVPLFIL
jgi:putative peptide zinc metalloprotease protein